MGLVVRLVIQAKRSEQGNVIVLRHLMEVKDASDLIARKQHATLKDVQLTGNGDHGEVMVLVVRLVIQVKRSEKGNVIVKISMYSCITNQILYNSRPRVWFVWIT